MSDPTFVTARVAGERGVADALQGLRQAGLSRESIEILSNVPLPEPVLGGPMKSTKLPVWTGAGLLIGLGLGVFFSIGTLFLYPVLVGGQPIRFAPPNLVIVYELTMFGIIVSTVSGFISETRLRPAARPYWRDVSLGAVYVVVEVPPDLVEARVRRALEEHGAEVVEAEEVLP
ncbi:MAG: DUF3341 domain-containing protein [Thermoleophilia bacterium]|nr:DUF3341 domain-containing protein [Thermoleophilia bacterium]